MKKSELIEDILCDSIKTGLDAVRTAEIIFAFCPQPEVFPDMVVGDCSWLSGDCHLDNHKDVDVILANLLERSVHLYDRSIIPPGLPKLRKPNFFGQGVDALFSDLGCQI